MKILQVNCVYKKGSTGKIASDIHTELQKKNIDSVVCYGRGEKVREEHVYKVCGELYSKVNHLISNLTGIIYGGCCFSTRKLISVIKKEKPDVVHLQCINGYFVNIYELVEWLKDNHVKTVVTLHAEFMYTGGCGHSIDCSQWSDYEGCGHIECPRWHTDIGSWFLDRTATMWKKMKKAFEGFNDNLIVTSVSPWLMERAAHSPILEGKDHRVVLNGVDSEVFHVYETENLRKKHYLTDEKVIFHATAGFNLNPDDIKGGYYVNEVAKMFAGANIRFIVAGSCPRDIKVSDNIILLGKITDQKLLAQYYSMADLTLLTSRRETFSMVTAESLCCGTPVVGFKAGGPEQIGIREYSSFVEYADMGRLKTAVLGMLYRRHDKYGIGKKAATRYGKGVMCGNYIKIYRELCEGQNKNW